MTRGTNHFFGPDDCTAYQWSLLYTQPSLPHGGTAHLVYKDSHASSSWALWPVRPSLLVLDEVILTQLQNSAFVFLELPKALRFKACLRPLEWQLSLQGFDCYPSKLKVHPLRNCLWLERPAAACVAQSYQCEGNCCILSFYVMQLHIPGQNVTLGCHCQKRFWDLWGLDSLLLPYSIW